MRLLVADTFNQRVCCFRVSDGSFAGVGASSGAHGLSDARDVVKVVGGVGRVVVADYLGHRVVRVPAGSPTTVLGSGAGSSLGSSKSPLHCTCRRTGHRSSFGRITDHGVGAATPPGMGVDRKG